jgi:hypothetical protein
MRQLLRELWRAALTAPPQRRPWASPLPRAGASSAARTAPANPPHRSAGIAWPCSRPGRLGSAHLSRATGVVLHVAHAVGRATGAGAGAPQKRFEIFSRSSLRLVFGRPCSVWMIVCCSAIGSPVTTSKDSFPDTLHIVVRRSSNVHERLSAAALSSSFFRFRASRSS